MPVLRGRLRGWTSAALFSALAPGCGRVGYDLLGSAEIPADSRTERDASAGRGNDAEAGSTGAGGGPEGAGGTTTSTGGGGGGPGTGGIAVAAGGSTGTPGAGGVASSGDAGMERGGASGRDAGTERGGAGGGISPLDASVPGLPAVDCHGGRVLEQLWTFATGVDSWYFTPSAAVSGSMTRVLTPSDLDPGALLVDITAVAADSRSWVQTDSPARNLAGHTAYAAIWLDSDVTAMTKLFAQSGATGVWMDGGTLVLTPHAWTCFALVFDAPDYVSGTADLTAVSRLGLELSGFGPFRVYIDDIGY